MEDRNSLSNKKEGQQKQFRLPELNFEEMGKQNEQEKQ